MVLTACGGPGRAAPPAGDGAGASGPDADRKGPTPLAEFLGWTEGAASDGLSDQELQQERLVQELVARCMRAQGFEYVPEEPVANVSSGGAGPFALPPADFAAQYGYGITTIDAADRAGAETDPNQAIVGGLSPGAREAYRHALYGEAGARPLPGWIEPLPGGAAQGDPDDAPEQDAGCYQDAQDEVYGPVGTAPDSGLAAAFAELEDELTALQERIDREPRVEAAQAEWAHCMADAGHSQYTSPDDPRQVIGDRFRELTGLSGAPLTGPTPGPAESAELQALRSHERAAAQADLACRGTYDGTVTDVRFELEREFVADHRELLERYRELAGIARGEN